MSYGASVCVYLLLQYLFWTLEILFRSNVGVRKPQRGIYGEARRLRRRFTVEVLAKVFLAHSYPGFFRTGDLSSLVFRTEDV